MPEWLQIVLLGVIEGITEFLPISSTGHLLLVEHLIDLRRTDLFNIVIQTSAVLAVLPLFAPRLRSCLRWRDSAGRDYLGKLAAAFCLTGLGGWVLDQMNFQLPETLTPVAWALLLGGVGFIWIERHLAGSTGSSGSDNITWTIAIAVGLGQLLAAIFPGASRSGTTILAALLLGLSRPAATEFSFLVGIPTMAAAGGLKLYKQLRAADAASAENWALLGLGTAVSAIVSFIVVKWFLRFIQTHTFTGFGWYRVGLGALLLLLALR